ncbi:hypothetical protein JP28_12715 [Gallibacterium anatis]|uniref:hypothetical protein n=1 Tax=Gallibacterium anatis TaxID=750 RepID=UPI000531310D|nr:hypothetical protein [Gallibacterium anatis]KGQ40325.1 hypothetical protein JP28_12715 [Gallibacterium anatis]KGQ47476.1 hypothetical protein IO46_13165 [Gallibacterium anatis]
MAKLNEHIFCVKYMIWDTYIAIKDYGEYIMVELPSSKKEGNNSTILRMRKIKVTDELEVNLLRKCVLLDKQEVETKDGRYFSIYDIVYQNLTERGWQIDDFK